MFAIHYPESNDVVVNHFREQSERSCYTVSVEASESTGSSAKHDKTLRTVL
jgi:hypothetical protein